MSVIQSTNGMVANVLQRPAIRQFIKFCIVGASSTAISFSIFYTLVYIAHLDRIVESALTAWPTFQAFCIQKKVYVQLASLAGFMVSVTNGFIWNSRWTFRQTDREQARRQYTRFVLVNIVGLLLNQTILFIGNQMLTAGKPQDYKGPETLVAYGIAVFIVVFWNFTANKLWTFKS